MSALAQLSVALPPHPPPLATTTHTALLTALSSATSLSHLKQVHAQILRFNLSHSHSLLINLLLTSCSLSSLDYALSVFSHFPTPPSPLSNKFLRALSRSAKPQYTLCAYEEIRGEGLGVDRFSFPPLLKAAGKVSGLNEGKEIHGLAAKMGFELDPFVQTGLVGMYAACGRIMDARLVFDKMSQRDVVTWSIMMDGYCQSGLFNNVFQLFEEMKSSNVEPDGIILSIIISACGRAGNLSYGKEIHEYLKEKHVFLDPYLQSALVTMYANCGRMDTAQELYDRMSPKNLIVSTAMLSGYSKMGQIKMARLIFNHMVDKDMVCWSAMISGYAESDQPQEALNLFKEMQVLGIKPDQITMLSVVSACAHLGALDQAKQIHIYVDKNGFGKAVAVNNALVDMYAKCGSLERAREVFNNMPRRNVISWTSMINAFSMHGDAHNALGLFHEMKNENVEPNGVTFVGLLYACSHAGLVEVGRKIFSSMINEYNITPKHEHYGCMVDLFGRANLLREALELVESMPMAPNVVIWGSLMAACRVHGEIELGEFAAKRLLELEPDHDGALVLLSNIYAKDRRWQDVGEVRKLMKERGISKERGCSRIELNNDIHEFLVADRNHEQADQIYDKLDEVVGKLKLVGYAPNTRNILLDLEEEEKKEVVLWHSEKLALSYGLISGEKGSSIRIVKNLRVCEDCHTFLKLVSKVYESEIIVRDRTRFHHYKDGACSCKDFW
ncbi:pentatricopeptide repeat-containing protein [Tripterygium wilfordii]|uniref:Pentatricopeptide repeat-containing protein n=2 Tax=Tripterygium wilfordii TaxID=458696 RepID=A0A7J7CRZ7_TRIWF|nr:pentatricopeptide repeat-containing protein At4g14820 isoform X2 [Tripterygium wilfordii]KAF5736877.1 pentatricopeptide repeat-containing protein [Tripterygium wilfordii]